MTPQEKAKVLVESFENYVSQHDFFGDNIQFKMQKQCALIAVDEILNSAPSYRYWDTYDDEEPSAVTFWKEVKQEIEKL